LFNHQRGSRSLLRGRKTTIAHKQLEASAIDITCAKLGEAEVIAEEGVRLNVLVEVDVGNNRCVGERMKPVA
jgi:D-serine deaminase-like pyridoxal phosphate-dependent protein